MTLFSQSLLVVAVDLVVDAVDRWFPNVYLLHSFVVPSALACVESALRWPYYVLVVRG